MFKTIQPHYAKENDSDTKEKYWIVLECHKNVGL